MKQREGKLSAYQGQELRWLVKNESAIGFRNAGCVEIFKASKNDKCLCGYQFTFQFTFAQNGCIAQNLRRCGYGGQKRKEFCDNAAQEIENKGLTVLKHRKPINLSYTEEASQAMLQGREESKRDKSIDLIQES